MRDLVREERFKWFALAGVLSVLCLEASMEVAQAQAMGPPQQQPQQGGGQPTDLNSAFGAVAKKTVAAGTLVRDFLLAAAVLGFIGVFAMGFFGRFNWKLLMTLGGCCAGLAIVGFIVDNFFVTNVGGKEVDKIEARINLGTTTSK